MTQTDEAQLTFLCQDAGLSPFHTRCTVLHLQGHAPYQIARALTVLPPALASKHRNRRLRRAAHEVSEALESAASLLALHYPDLRSAGREFVRQLTLCQANRGVYDERQPGVSGVSPAPEAKGFRCGKTIPSDDRRLIQTPVACLRLWGQQQVQVAVP